MQVAIRIGLLGTLVVRDHTGLIAVAGAKLQALLALLALSTPHPVPDDRIFEELWGDQLPANPPNALQAQISQLRRVLGRDAIARVGVGYALAVDTDDVDAVHLERLARQGRDAADRGDHGAAASRYEAAVDLLRGVPLVELLHHRFAREASVRLEELGLAAHEGLADAHLALGRHAEVVGQLTDLVHAHPLRERFHAQLMLALYRSGRQSDALRAYQQVREALAEELGLEPGPELRALERAVLIHDPSVAAPVTLDSSAPAVVRPRPLTSFVGREEELVSVARATTSARLVTLIGPAGVGKTRLVLELADRLEPTREVWFVELAPVTDPVAVPEAIATALGALDQTSLTDSRPPDIRAADRIGSRAATMVVDNCEHVVAAAAECLRTLLARCPNLAVVATSREPLGLAGEQQLAIGPLPADDAATLFGDRARAVQPLFGGDDTTAAEVAELCRRLDGLPLAIELAAARTKTLPLEEITSRLDDRFQLLRETGRAGDGRHRGLGAAIAWSYDSLFEDERRAFRHLAVFAGGISIAAAAEVCGSDSLDIVTHLVDKSLLVAETSGRTARFRLLESLRAYGLERLAEAGELDQAFERHLRWCTRLAEEAALGVRGADQLVWLERLDAEHDNVRAALSRAVEVDPVTGLRLIGALVWPWWVRGRRQEARHWAEACLPRVDDASDDVAARALSWCGLLADNGSWTDPPGEFEHELDLADRRQRGAVELAGNVDDRSLQAYCLVLRGLTLARRTVAGIAPDRTELASLLERCTKSFELLGDDFGAAMTRIIEAVAALGLGDLDGAAGAIESARGHGTRSGDRFALGRASWIQGLLAQAAGDPAEAYRHIERGLRLLDELGMGREVTAQANLLVGLAERSSQPEVAEMWRTFVADRTGGLARHDMLLVASARNAEGLRARSSGDHARALDAHEEALARYGEAGVTSGVAYTESCLGFLAVEMGDGRAGAHHTAALVAAAEAGEPSSLALALEGVASTFGDGEASWAASLLGAAEAARHDLAGAGPASHRADIDATRDGLRLALGPDGFRAAFERGAALGRADAVAAATTRRFPPGWPAQP